MSSIRVFLSRLLALFRKKRLDSELNAELASHLALHIEDNLREGMSPEEARRAALLKLGGLEQTKESVRDLRGIAWLEAVFQDLRFGLRTLRKNPGFSTVAILALALGIGFSSIVFSIFYNGVLHPFPYRNAERLAIIEIIGTRAGAIQYERVLFTSTKSRLSASSTTPWKTLPPSRVGMAFFRERVLANKFMAPS